MSNHQIEWDLSCSKELAIEVLQNSVGDADSPMFSYGKVKGLVDNNNFRIWSKTPGMRGIPIAIGKGQIIEKNNSSHLSAAIGHVWPFALFNLSTFQIIIVVLIAIISWLLSLVGGIFEEYRTLSEIFFPIGAIAILITLLRFIAYIGENELSDLTKFLERTFAKHRV